MSQVPVVSRLAPSPTGHLHLGHAVSFLAAWWSARSRDGRVVLRLEDLDTGRASQAHIEGALKDLRWLGIDWDGEIQIQSKRLENIRAAAEKLFDAGRAYPCICTRGDIKRAQGETDRSLNAPQQGDPIEHPYPGTCRDRFDTWDAAEASGVAAGLRFITPDEEVTFTDRVYGQQVFRPRERAGDFMILRRDKVPAYQLAVVVDDRLDEVSEVVRGRDLLESTARQILLGRALGFPSPEYLHVPLICTHSGRRLAKRHDDLSLKSLRESGVRPETVVRFAAQALGQEDPELASPGSRRGTFSASSIPRNDVCLPENPRKLF